MNERHHRYPAPISFCGAIGVALWLLLEGCGSHRGKLDPEGTADAGVAGSSAQRNDLGGEGGQAGLSSGGTFAGSSGQLGTAGVSGDDFAASTGGRATCVFHVEVPAIIDAGGSAGIAPADVAGTSATAGMGTLGTAGTNGATAPTITVQRHAILGEYLADARGMSLYLFGADTPGDCHHSPISACLAADACIVAWPVFHASPQHLAGGLDATLFGEFLRSDGVMQSTYRGWPLYFYKSDAVAGDAKGHGRGIWYLVETELPNVLVRRDGSTRFLSDSEGRTLYAFAEDTLGTADAPPRSACTGSCRGEHPPFMLRYMAPVSTLDPANFTIFLRSDGGAQMAFKGAPLYWSSSDLAPGDILGLLPGWSVVPDQ